MARPGVSVSEAVLATPVTAAPPTSAAGALVAPLPAGPNTPTLVSSWYQFTRVFGGLTKSNLATFAANQFFRAGGRELYVSRVVKTDAVKAEVTLLDGSDDYLTFTAKSEGTWGNNLRIRITKNIADLYDVEVLQEAGVAADYTDDTVLETYYNLDLATVGSQEVVDIFALRSQFIDVAWPATLTGLNVPTTFTVLPLVGGTDGGALAEYDYTAALASLAQVNRTFVIFSPGAVDTDTVTALVAWAETNKSFLVLDVAPTTDVAGAVTYADGVGPTTYAAVYYPNVWVADTTSRSRDALVLIPPSGGVAGLYLNTDATSGVWKSPAGLQSSLSGVVALERNLSAADLDDLNNDSSPVNAVRFVAGSGAVVMGARTLDQRASTRYINIRRTLLFLSREMEGRCEFALFRNNDATLWNQLTVTLQAFLNGVWQSGGLRGQTAPQAYYVKIDRENNTPTDVANGVVNIEVGVALQYPAEFVKIKLTQQTNA